MDAFGAECEIGHCEGVGAVMGTSWRSDCEFGVAEMDLYRCSL